MTDQKPTNPKDAVGARKAWISAVPAVARLEESLAFTEGGLKYGLYNYRAIGVRASIYLDAAQRHLDKWTNGEERDPKTGVHHLGSVRACLGIILQAQADGLLTDDRPPASPATVARLDAAEADVVHLQQLFAEHAPRHFTIADRPAAIGPTRDPGQCCYRRILSGECCALTAGHSGPHVLLENPPPPRGRLQPDE